MFNIDLIFPIYIYTHIFFNIINKNEQLRNKPSGSPKLYLKLHLSNMFLLVQRQHKKTNDSMHKSTHTLFIMRRSSNLQRY